MKLKALFFPALLALAAGTAAHATDGSLKIKNSSKDNWDLRIEGYKDSYGKAYFKNPTNPREDPKAEEMKEGFMGISSDSTATVTLNGNTAGIFDIIFTLKPHGSDAKPARFEVKSGKVYGWSTTVKDNASGVKFSDSVLKGSDDGMITLN